MKRLLRNILLGCLIAAVQAHGEEGPDQPRTSSLESSTLRSQFIEWISKQTARPSDEIQDKLILNSRLEKMQCREDIEFSFASKSGRLIKAVCEKSWRRFLRSPKWLEQDHEQLADSLGEISNQFVVASETIIRGDRFSNPSLSLGTFNSRRSDQFFTSIEEIVGSVASRNISPGEPISREDVAEGTLVITSATALSPGLILNTQLVREELRFLDVPNDALNSIEGWEFMEINQPLLPGEIIRARHLRKAKLIRRNDPVRLISSGSSFRIEATGVALQDGYFGDRIKVSNTESNRTLLGNVVDKSTVEILVD